GQINPRLRRLLRTRHPVFCFTGTASAAMEAALANAGGRKTLILSNGGFGERWGLAARLLGMKSELLDFGWGMPFDLELVKRILEKGDFSSVVMVHGETSTGMLNPIEPISALTANQEDVLLLVDAVATLGGVPLEMDRWGIDVLVGASQKCLALPPGIVPVGVSDRALKRSERSRRRGYAYDFTLWHDRWAEGEVVATPALPQLYALDYQLARIEAEGLASRWQRHARMLTLSQEWALAHGWRTFAENGSLLASVSCLIPLTNRNTAPIVEALRRRGYLVDEGYGRLKARIVRIGHMGDWQEEDLEGLLQALGEAHQEAH
ncbi:MAG TPA: aminotransferase class V-fold PLP-dependent enzyme, partial [bacterium]